MRARQEASTPSEKHHLDQKCSNILAKAERWKKQQEAEAGSIPAPASKHYAVAIASTPPPAGPPRKRPVPRAVKSLTLKEQTLLLKSGIINGNKFPPWEGRPTASEFPEEPFL